MHPSINSVLISLGIPQNAFDDIPEGIRGAVTTLINTAVSSIAPQHPPAARRGQTESVPNPADSTSNNTNSVAESLLGRLLRNAIDESNSENDMEIINAENVVQSAIQDLDLCKAFDEMNLDRQ